MRFSFLVALVSLPLIFAQGISKTGRCGAQFGLTCPGSSYGSCCSQYNYCGSTAAHCNDGCQSKFGTCTATSSNVAKKVSMDGSCAGPKGQTCLKSTFGDCCSKYGYCGKSTAYCGAGCNPAFGTCNDATTPSKSASSTTRTATPTHTSTLTSSLSHKVSTNARCGASFEGQTCQGSRWGNCCSQYSYCGSTSDYCRPDVCQQGYGTCNSASSSLPSLTTLTTLVRPEAIKASITESTYMSSDGTSTSSSSTTRSISSLVLEATSTSLSQVSSSSSTPSSTLANAPDLSSQVLSESTTSSSVSLDLASLTVASRASESTTSLDSTSTLESSVVSSLEVSSDVVFSTSTESIVILAPTTSALLESTSSSLSKPESTSILASSASASTSESTVITETILIPSTIMESPSSTPTSTASPLPKEFCLKNIMPNTPTTGYIVGMYGQGLNLRLQSSSAPTAPIAKTAYFNLTPTGQLATIDGLIIAVYTPYQSSQVLRPYTPAQIAASKYMEERCELAADNITLSCVASNEKFRFPKFVTGSQSILSGADESVSSGSAVQLGAFTGAACA